ncbi:hypothetical protein ACFPZ0_23235 [Streptomonospora nanhaiensis]|uniref:Uncharacterized protein n=1 Tax=Streptomonospora nanhaiensis TaxID=1323731 RepID=A0A853BUM3_9ACTN|nr:hypothetical protein [Streptomonospora nanhaiensis]MBV2362719.1 hypothetical protein [Streptomonospora nanhaiensis]MBX9390984.1 hypothetical protein [Streptomonospora nanhaiensis]NYI97932.1 hypothetical protein [Streptomonospora nanhaiensis]
MLLYELVRLQRTVDHDRDRQRHRLTARQIRAERRERERAERALMELARSRLC